VKPEIMHQTQPLETNPVTTPAAPEDSAPITPAGPRKDVPIQPALDTGCARRGHRVRKPKGFYRKLNDGKVLMGNKWWNFT
jgi:hypothetical protein